MNIVGHSLVYHTLKIFFFISSLTLLLHRIELGKVHIICIKLKHCTSTHTVRVGEESVSMEYSMSTLHSWISQLRNLCTEMLVYGV